MRLEAPGRSVQETCVGRRLGSRTLDGVDAAQPLATGLRGALSPGSLLASASLGRVQFEVLPPALAATPLLSVIAQGPDCPPAELAMPDTAVLCCEKARLPSRHWPEGQLLCPPAALESSGSDPHMRVVRGVEPTCMGAGLVAGGLRQAEVQGTRKVRCHRREAQRPRGSPQPTGLSSGPRAIGQQCPRWT